MKVQSLLVVLALLLSTPHAGAQDAGGVRVMSTRGFARTSALNKSAGKEAIVSYRFELPYGLAAGWKLPYLGFSEGFDGTILIKQVAIKIEEPKADVRRVDASFAGKKSVSVPANKVVESDAIDVALLPGAVIHVITFYRNEKADGSLPFMTWGYHDKDSDGCLVGDVDSLKVESLQSDDMFAGSSPALPLFAGVGRLFRSYQPMFVTGQPHPSFKGDCVAIGFIGDSINIAQNDFDRTSPGDHFPARGWNGRYCGSSKSYVVYGQGGSNCGGFISQRGSQLFNYLFGTGKNDQKVTHLVDAYGINSIRATNLIGENTDELATRRADAIWKQRQEVASIAKDLGIPYIQATLTPCKAGVLWDTYAKTEADRLAPFAAARGKFNDKVRHESQTIPGCIGFIDWGDAVETDPASNNNQWQPVDSDGIHPNSLGHQKMSEKVGDPFKIPSRAP